MKTGVIIYVVGDGKEILGHEPEEAVKDLDLSAERIEVVISGSNNFDVMDAWWRLTSKGMNKIVCMMAEVNESSELRLTGRELRLCG